VLAPVLHSEDLDSVKTDLAQDRRSRQIGILTRSELSLLDKDAGSRIGTIRNRCKAPFFRCDHDFCRAAQSRMGTGAPFSRQLALQPAIEQQSPLDARL